MLEAEYWALAVAMGLRTLPVKDTEVIILEP